MKNTIAVKRIKINTINYWKKKLKVEIIIALILVKKIYIGKN